jgi:uncharacterized protein (DUF433 family)
MLLYTPLLRQKQRIEEGIAMSVLLGNGAYSFGEAARLTRLRIRRVREWFRGRSDGSRKAVFESDYRDLCEENLISFLDLVEVFIAGQLRSRGVALQTIRKVHTTLRAELRVQHPFCRKELYTFGRRIFTHGLDDSGRVEITDVLSKQKVFPKVIQPFLRSLDYDSATMLARRWRIAPKVVVNPDVCFGQPIVEAAGIPTAVLFRSFRANSEKAETVADWFGVSREDVIAAVEFERGFAA